jgi:hypothetical protein
LTGHKPVNLILSLLKQKESTAQVKLNYRQWTIALLGKKDQCKCTSGGPRNILSHITQLLNAQWKIRFAKRLATGPELPPPLCTDWIWGPSNTYRGPFPRFKAAEAWRARPQLRL